MKLLLANTFTNDGHSLKSRTEWELANNSYLNLGPNEVKKSQNCIIVNNYTTLSVFQQKIYYFRILRTIVQGIRHSRSRVSLVSTRRSPTNNSWTNVVVFIRVFIGRLNQNPSSRFKHLYISLKKKMRFLVTSILIMDNSTHFKV